MVTNPQLSDSGGGDVACWGGVSAVAGGGGEVVVVFVRLVDDGTTLGMPRATM